MGESRPLYQDRILRIGRCSTVRSRERHFFILFLFDFYLIFFDEIIAHSEVVVAVVVGFSDEGEIL